MSVIKINYITNLSVQDSSGGWSGMNFNVFRQLADKFEINTIEKINPPYGIPAKIISKLLRSVGMKGSFPAFTAARLNRITKLVEEKIQNDAAYNFYHGVTPWIYVKNKLPYALYTDACFATYIGVYHDDSRFGQRQLNRIFNKEKEFLSKADVVFFSSEWALEDTKKCYGLAGNNFSVAGLGGGYEKKTIIKVEATAPYFLFVGLDFVGKGGYTVCDAFERLSKKFPDFMLKLVGQRPPEKYLQNKKISYCGFFNKVIASESKALKDLFSGAYCFLLPTVKDMTPLVLVEAGSVGCPAISVNNFGIPEIVINGQTGILLNKNELTKDSLLSAMETICSDLQRRNNWGINAEKYIEENFSWQKTGAKICDELEKNFYANKFSDCENVPVKK